MLELTLKHLQELRRQKNAVNLAKNNSSDSHKQHFNSGYKACASEVSRYLESISFPSNHSNVSINGAFGANLMSHLGKQLQVIEMGPSFVTYNHPSPSTTHPLSVMTYSNDVSKTSPQLPCTSSSYRLPSSYYSATATSNFSVNTSGRTLSSSSDCGYSSGRDSVSPHSFASTALSPSSGEMECPASPKINVEDVDEEETAVDMTTGTNLVQPQANRLNSTASASSEVVWRPF